MSADFLHNHPQFPELIRIVAQQRGIDPALVEKDYWIMHSLYGLQKLGLTFELKGGTSLSKGFEIIDRFSEDIDIHIDPPADRIVRTVRDQDRPAHMNSRKDFYDWLASTKIQIDGIYITVIGQPSNRFLSGSKNGLTVFEGCRSDRLCCLGDYGKHG